MRATKTLFNLKWLTLIVALAFFLGIEETRAESVLYGVAHTTTRESVLYQVDPATGEATKVGPIGFQGCNGMDFDASGTLYATCKSQSVDGNLVLVIINLETGAGQLVGDSGITMRDDALRIGSDISFRNSDGVLFGYFLDSEFGDFLGTIDLSTGDVVDVAWGSLVEFGNGLAFSPTDALLQSGSLIRRPGRLIYAKLHTLDQVADADGFLGISSSKNLRFSSTPEDTNLTIPRINAMDFEPRTGILFASVNDGGTESYLAIVSAKNGKVTLLGKTQDSLDAIAFFPVNTEAASTTNGPLYLKCNKVARGRYIRKHEEVEVILKNSSESIKVRVLKPVSLCTVLNDDGDVLTESTTSLTCYRVKDVARYRKSGHRLRFEWRHVDVTNEFGDQTLSVVAPQTLCVPTEVTDDRVKIKTWDHKKRHHSKDHEKDDD